MITWYIHVTLYGYVFWFFFCYLLCFWHNFIYTILLHCLSFFCVCGCVCGCGCVCVIYCDFLLIISDVKMKIKALDLVSSGKDEKKWRVVQSGLGIPDSPGIQPVFNFKIIHPYPHCRTPPPSALTKNLWQGWLATSLSPIDPIFWFAVTKWPPFWIHNQFSTISDSAPKTGFLIKSSKVC